jgi:RNA polymerase sigma factor (TIGR02999 family)
MRQERRDHILQTTALVNEAYLRLREGDDEHGKLLYEDDGRKAFYFAAARTMRNILIDEARKRKAAKRGGPDRQKVSLDTGVLITGAEPDYLELHDALEKLENLESRAGRVVELRFFGGMTMQEIAILLDVSLRTVEKDWAFARAWLRRELIGDTADAE